MPCPMYYYVLVKLGAYCKCLLNTGKWEDGLIVLWTHELWLCWHWIKHCKQHINHYTNTHLGTYSARMPTLFTSCNIGIHIPWCSIYDPSSEYQFISAFDYRSPRICDNVSNFWWNTCVSQCLHNWMANNFIFLYSGFCTDLFYGKVNLFGGSSTGGFTSNFTIMGNQTCFLPWYNHDPWGLLLHYFCQNCSY